MCKVDVITRKGDVVEAPDRLVGRGRPLCADFDGALLAVGFEDGGLAIFGVRGWLRFHTGAVGAVKVVPGKMQVGGLYGHTLETGLTEVQVGAGG